MPLPAHGRLLYCTTSTRGLDSARYGMIILIPEPSRLKLPLPYSCLHPDSITYWFPPPRNAQQGQRNLSSPRLSLLFRRGPSSILFHSLHSAPVFSFLLVPSSSLSLLTPSIMHAHHDQAYLCLNKLFCSPGNRGEGRKAWGSVEREGHRGAYFGGRAKHTICNRSYSVRFSPTWMRKPQGR